MLLPWSLYIGTELGFSVAKISQIAFKDKDKYIKIFGEI